MQRLSFVNCKEERKEMKIEDCLLLPNSQLPNKQSGHLSFFYWVGYTAVTNRPPNSYWLRSKGGFIFIPLTV
jgi:hypothetical protein